MEHYHRKRKILVLAGFFLLLLSFTWLWGRPEGNEPIGIRFLFGALAIHEKWLGKSVRSTASFSAYISEKQWESMEKRAAPRYELPSANKYLLVKANLEDWYLERSVRAIVMLPKSYEPQMAARTGSDGRIPFSGRLIGYIENSNTDTPTPIILVSEALFYNCYEYVMPADLLSRIAQKTGVPSQELIRINPDVDWSRLYVGQWYRTREDCSRNE